ncbi:hypothetical protein HBH1_03265 [Herbaspirillum sp. BH-1]|nr:hypothetical protein [Herbaspirillum sp. BH-1]PLY58474.1 hypothetical protein HBH1_03265 [Herbaspirillum sp. BH-1]
MYPDPNRIRQNRHMVRLDAYEQAIVEALANYQGEPVSTVIRQLAMSKAEELLPASTIGSVNTVGR